MFFVETDHPFPPLFQDADHSSFWFSFLSPFPTKNLHYIPIERTSRVLCGDEDILSPSITGPDEPESPRRSHVSSSHHIRPNRNKIPPFYPDHNSLFLQDLEVLLQSMPLLRRTMQCSG